MKKMISKFLGAVAVCTFLISAQPVAAQCCPQLDLCCNPCDMCGRWEVGAHALVFTPIACPYDFAVFSPENTSFDVTTVSCDLDWGFRVFGRYVSDCTFLGVSYQWYQAKAKKTVDNVQLVRGMPNITPAIRADGKVRFEYQNVDVSLGKYLYQDCRYSFFVFGNIRWIDLTYSRHTRAISQTFLAFNANEKSRLEGAGLGVGIGAEYDIWCDIGIFGVANVLGVIAERSTSNVFAPVNNTVNPQDVVRAKYRSDTCINPEVNFRLGLDYSWTCGCWTLVGEIGYELDYFWDAFSFPRGSITTDVNRFRNCENVGFSGLFFGGRLLF